MYLWKYYYRPLLPWVSNWIFLYTRNILDKVWLFSLVSARGKQDFHFTNPYHIWWLYRLVCPWQHYGANNYKCKSPESSPLLVCIPPNLADLTVIIRRLEILIWYQFIIQKRTHLRTETENWQHPTLLQQ